MPVNAPLRIHSKSTSAFEKWLLEIFEQESTEETEKGFSVCSFFSVASVQIGTWED
jgi:hypothetical protein